MVTPCAYCGATDHEQVVTAIGALVGCPQMPKHIAMFSVVRRRNVPFTPGEVAAEPERPPRDRTVK